MFSLKEFLRKEVKPALGCTEPAAVALAVARASEELPSGEIRSIRVVVSDSVYKNGMAVVIPGTQGMRGNAIAAALGAICGKSAYGLEVLRDCNLEHVRLARQWVQEGLVEVFCDPMKHGVYIEATVTKGECWAKSLIFREHTNFVEIIRDGVTVFKKAFWEGALNEEESLFEVMKNTPYEELLKLADDMDADDIQYVLQGVDMNMRIAEFGLQRKEDDGFCFGKRMQALVKQQGLENDLGYLIRMFCYAAADARMSGAKLPVMSSAGSGNHGITAILPVALLGKKMHKDSRTIAKALVISHLSTSFVKSRLGRLSQVCGCAIAAGAGAAAGMVFLLGGDVRQMEEAMRIVIVNTAGMICDGAKESCSLKVGTGAFEAYIAALFSMSGSKTGVVQGLLNPSIEKTVGNVAKIEQEGMCDLDKVILEILGETSLHANE